MDPNAPESVIGFLQENAPNPDPGPGGVQAHVILNLYSVEQLARLRDALASKTVTHNLWFNFDNYVESSDIHALLSVLMTCEKLDAAVGLVCMPRSPPGLIGRFLRAIAKNSGVLELRLVDVRIPAESLTLLLQVSKSIAAIYLRGCVVEAPDNGVAAECSACNCIRRKLFPSSRCDL